MGPARRIDGFAAWATWSGLPWQVYDWGESSGKQFDADISKHEFSDLDTYDGYSAHQRRRIRRTGPSVRVRGLTTFGDGPRGGSDHGAIGL